MVSISQLTMTFNKKVVLDHIDLQLSRGEIYGITGLSGSGKSVLLKILATILKPSQGKIEISGYDTVKNTEKVRSLIGYMPDQTEDRDPLTVREHLNFFYSMYMGNRHKPDAVMGELLDALNMKEYERTLLSELSRGQNQMISLARAMIHNPDVLLLDNPEAGVDWEDWMNMESFLKEYCRKGKTIIVASHSVDILNRLAHRIGVLHQGRLLWTLPAGVENQNSIQQRLAGIKRG